MHVRPKLVWCDSLAFEHLLQRRLNQMSNVYGAACRESCLRMLMRGIEITMFFLLNVQNMIGKLTLFELLMR